MKDVWERAIEMFPDIEIGERLESWLDKVLVEHKLVLDINDALEVKIKELAARVHEYERLK